MNNQHQPTQQRLVIRFGKFGPLKYTSNLDLAKIWERVLRRAGLPLQYSHGFNTRPRMALISALPLGLTSECELLDVSLREPVAPAALCDRLAAVSPAGLRIYETHEIPVKASALQPLLRSAEYRVHFLDGINAVELRARIAALLDSDTLVRTSEHKGRQRAVDLRPLIYDLHVDDAGDLLAHIAAGEQGNLRTQDLLAELGVQAQPHSVHRLRLHLDSAPWPTDL
jgi:radical SAM-linked protein